MDPGKSSTCRVYLPKGDQSEKENSAGIVDKSSGNYSRRGSIYLSKQRPDGYIVNVMA